ncbi:E3 ubiquitin-protein ligase DZIP3-like [Dendronephthya gigantea]|uniref:E3 ubiquitin-protein ligase DZIP3-like n=1 Tax=Dendronephthya gigantea TaxID=151771 RepID=UPI00106ACF1B|nr:E3 ubiquitin-protein ligase DZIP3-like [Dendronephthya gigantea]
MPPDTDRSEQANITRIKCYRNEVIAHVTTTRVDNSTFESLWKKIAQAIVELGVSQSDVDDLKKCPLGPEEEVYVQKLKDWKLHEDECIKMLATMTQIVEETRDGVNLLCQSLLKKSENETPQTSLKRTLSIPEDANPEKNSCKESGEDVLRKLAKHNFKNKIQKKVKLFLPGTREWLLREVDEWFCSIDSDSRIKLITAGPGFGKSVFAAKICEDFEKNGKLAACHFCDFSNSNLRDPMVMLESLASQMCKSLPSFKEQLLDQLGRRHQVQNLRDAFLIYLQNPLDELEIKEPRLVVIDGLDESAADNKNEIAHLIAEYFPELPECIKILVTSRPEISVADLRLRDDQKTDISNVHDDNNLDLELYFKQCFPSLVGREVDKRELSDDFYKDNLYFYRVRRNGIIILLSIFVAKCQGSFLYAYHFESGLKKRYDLKKITDNDVMEFLPEGLHSVYERYCKRLEDELNAIKHEKFDVLKILEMLAASEEDVPLTFVAQVFGLTPDCRETKDIINKINETISCLLYVSDDMLTAFHKSFIDWLLAKGYKDHQYTVKVDDGHRSLWLLCEKVFKGMVESVR